MTAMRFVVLLALLTRVWSECTPRCTDVSSDGYFQGSELCSRCPDTWRPRSATCHYHMRYASEAAQCMYDNQFDIILVGASYTSGLFANIVEWHTPSLHLTSYVDLVRWMGTERLVKEGDLTPLEMAVAEVHIRSDGAVTYKAATALPPDMHADTPFSSTVMEEFLAKSPSTRSRKVMFVFTRFAYETSDALTMLHDAGRLDRALVVINTGAWDQYCIGYGYCVPNTYTQVHRTNPQAVYAYLASQLDYLLSSTYLKPALKVYIAGYQNVVRDLNEVLQMTANKHGALFMNFASMCEGGMVDGHPVNSEQLWMYQRMLSTICDISAADTECDEMAIGEDDCHPRDISNFRWYTNYYQPCAFNSTRTFADGTSSFGSSYQPLMNYTTPSDSMPLWVAPTPSPRVVPSPSNSTTASIDGKIDLATTHTVLKAQPIPVKNAKEARLKPFIYKNPRDYNALVILSILICASVVLESYFKRRCAAMTRKYIPDAPASSAIPAGITTNAEPPDQAKAIALKPRVLTNNTAKTSVKTTVCKAANIEEGVQGQSIGESCDCKPECQRLVSRAEDITQAREKNTSTDKIESLAVARLLASLHVVGGHLVRLPQKPLHPYYVLNWGYTWVPWFFMLSGFVLTYAGTKHSGWHQKPQQAKTTSQQIQDSVAFVKKRMHSILPLYMLGLLAAFLIAIRDNYWQRTTTFTFVTEMTLTQAWFPNVTEHVLQSHCWFVSAIIPFWALHGRMMDFFRTLSLRNLWLCMLGLYLCSWLIVMIPAAAGIDEQWYRAHKWKSNSTVIDVLVIMLKFHPLFYLHLYALGVALACVYRHYQGNFPTLFRSGAVIGYAGLALIFTTPSLIPPAHKLSARLGVLAPLQGLVLLGLAIGEDPIAKLFSWWPLQVLAGYSYAVYIFQFICFDLWQEYVDLGFICFLVATAICAQRFANTFLASSPAVFERNAKALAVLTFVALLIWSSLPTNIANLLQQTRAHAHGTSTPDYVRYSDTAYDVKLHLSSSGRFEGFHPHEYSFINPSIAYYEGNLLIAARRHTKTVAFSNCKNEAGVAMGGKVLRKTTWYSDIVVGTLDPTSLRQQGDLKKVNFYPQDASTRDWTPCAVTPVYHHVNDSYTQTVVTGPQDPRIILHPTGEVQLSFYSDLPTTNETCPTTGLVGTVFLSNPISVSTSQGKTAVQPSNLVAATTILPPYDEGIREKNWITLPVESEARSSLLMVRSYSPLTFVEVVNGKDTVLPPFLHKIYRGRLDHAVEAAEVAAHGGSNAVRVSWGGTEYFLAVFHTISKARNYVNYLVKLSVNVPYTPMAVSEPLPLIVPEPSCATFASGLEVIGQTIFVAYGSCDMESRILVLDKVDLDALFASSKGA